MGQKKELLKADVRARQRVKEILFCLKLMGHDVKSGFLLDLGCGRGDLDEYFLDLGINFVGVEVLRRQIKKAKKNLPEGTFVLADGAKLPFREDFFDTVLMNDVLEHVPYSYANPVLRDVKRTLKASGVLYISVANKFEIHEPHTNLPFLTWFPRRFWNAIHKVVRKRPLREMYYPYTFKALERLCRDSGFRCRNFTWLYVWNKISNLEYVGSPTVRKLAKALRKLGIADQIIPFAQKFSVILFACTKNN